MLRSDLIDKLSKEKFLLGSERWIIKKSNLFSIADYKVCEINALYSVDCPIIKFQGKD